MPNLNQISDQELYDNGVFVHSLVMFAGAVVMFRGYKDAQPVVFATGAAVTVAGAHGLNKNHEEYIKRCNRRRLNAN